MTTVATLLKIMEEKGLARRTADRRWQAAVSTTQAGQGLVQRLLHRVFDGSVQRLVAHVVQSHPLSDAELDELRELLDSHKSKNLKSQAKRT